MKLTGDCNCGNRLACGCTLSFSSYVASSTSVLDVGTLQGSSCSFAEYVIDWYRNGVKELVSGTVGSAPDVSAYHPFTGLSAIPVPQGTWVPVVRYVRLTGQTNKIFLNKTNCQDWCTDLTGLPTIMVNSIYCGLIGTGNNAPSIYYDYAISYNTTQDYSLASRKIIFTLDENAVVFAFQFTASVIADQINIYYKDSTTSLWMWRVGGEIGLSTAQFVTPPYRVVGSSFKQAILLPVYTVGDYLTIEILPGVLSGNVNTIWKLDMKCLNSSYVFEYNHLLEASRAYDINTFALTYNSPLCRFELDVQYGALYLGAPTTLNIQRYSGAVSTSSGCSQNSSTRVVKSTFGYAVNTSNWTNAPSGAGTKITSFGNVYISKTSNVITIVCDDIADFNDFQDGYSWLSTNTWKTQWVNDPTNLAYYRYYQMNFFYAISGCGDGETSQTFYFHITSGFTFNSDTKTITITCPTISNGLTPPVEPCNYVYSYIDGRIVLMNNTTNLADFAARQTRCRWKYPLGYGTRHTVGLPSISGLFQMYTWFSTPFCTPQPMNAIMALVYSGSRWGWFYHYMALVINATRDAAGAWTQNPLDYFSVYLRYNKHTGADANILIYQKVNGVETVKIAWEDL